MIISKINTIASRLVLNFYKRDCFRKADGKRYGDAVASFRNAEFPFPSGAQVEVAEDTSAQAQWSDASYFNQIADLQDRLHTSISQLEVANVCPTIWRDRQIEG